jgi:FkbM family methyltransferase
MAIYDQIVLRPYLPRDRNYRTIIDCGANIGLTVRYWKAAYPDATVIAVEPDPANFDLLRANTAGLANVHCIRAGVWPVSGRLRIEREELGSSSFRTHEAQEVGDTDAVTIPDLLARFGIDRLSLLKVDIEGAEKELFAGPHLQWLERVDAIAIELHDQWKPGCGDAFFKAIAPFSWTYSIHGEMILCEKRLHG